MMTLAGNGEVPQEGRVVDPPRLFYMESVKEVLER